MSYGDFGQYSAAAGVFGVFFVFFYLIMLAVGIAVYVMQALWLQKMAKNRGEENAWFAWIPLLNYVLIGNMVGPMKIGKYDVKKPGIAMLVLSLGVIAVELVGTLLIALLVNIPVLGWVLCGLIGIVLVAYPILVAVFFYFMLFKFYKQYNPEKAVMFLVLTIFFSTITMTVFLFINRDKLPVSSLEPAPERLQ